MSLVERVSKHNTHEVSVICCIEEMSELTKVLCKESRKSSKFSKENLTEELAHVMLMCAVIANENDITPSELEREQIDAVERMEGLK